MKTETSNDVLADGVRHVVDAETLRVWVEGPVKAVLPHEGMLCGQSVPHAGGYAAIQKWSFGLPQAYETAIACAGPNVRSPILVRLLRSGGPEFFDVEHDQGFDVDAVWRRNFTLAGWRNLLGFCHREGTGDELVVTSAAFYNVGQQAPVNAGQLQSAVMPHLHVALTRVHQAAVKHSSSAVTDAPRLSPAERAVVSLLLLGKTNKEIGKQLGKSDETVKSQLAMLMQRLCVRNRTELAHLMSEERSKSR